MANPGPSREQWTCPKCNYQGATESKLRGSGGWLASALDVNTTGFRVLTCPQCQYSELYKAEGDWL